MNNESSSKELIQIEKDLGKAKESVKALKWRYILQGIISAFLIAISLAAILITFATALPLLAVGLISGFVGLVACVVYYFVNKYQSDNSLSNIEQLVEASKLNNLVGQEQQRKAALDKIKNNHTSIWFYAISTLLPSIATFVAAFSLAAAALDIPIYVVLVGALIIACLAYYFQIKITEHNELMSSYEKEAVKNFSKVVMQPNSKPNIELSATQTNDASTPTFTLSTKEMARTIWQTVCIIGLSIIAGGLGAAAMAAVLLYFIQLLAIAAPVPLVFGIATPIIGVLSGLFGIFLVYKTYQDNTEKLKTEVGEFEDKVKAFTSSEDTNSEEKKADVAKTKPTVSKKFGIFSDPMVLSIIVGIFAVISAPIIHVLWVGILVAGLCFLTTIVFKSILSHHERMRHEFINKIMTRTTESSEDGRVITMNPIPKSEEPNKKPKEVESEVPPTTVSKSGTVPVAVGVVSPVVSSNLTNQTNLANATSSARPGLASSDQEHTK
jgi:hypothetical protein